MDLETVKAICKQFDCWCNISGSVNRGGTVSYRFRIFGLSKEKVLEIRKLYDLGQMDKIYSMGDEDWRVGNIVFDEVEKCKIVGYKKETVPEHVNKTPIYDCNGKK